MNTNNQPQSVELFSGTKSISKIFALQGYKTLTIDINPKTAPDLCIDILDLTSDQLPPVIDLLWASPLCKYFSRASDPKHWLREQISYRNYIYHPLTCEALTSIALLDKTIEIIRIKNPQAWFLENPVGRIHHSAALRSIGHNRYFVNYADFGFPYSKETYIFTNLLLALPEKKTYRYPPGFQTMQTKSKRSIIPDNLIHFLLSQLPGTCNIENIPPSD